jgi:putative component of toxin-antitoxin plasmid stabilization module
MKDNFDDCEPIDEGVFEMQLHPGVGYQIY